MMSEKNNTVDQIFEEQGYTQDAAVNALMSQFGVPDDEEDGASLSEPSEGATEDTQDEAPEKDEQSQETEEGDTTEDEGEGSEDDEGDDESTDEEDSDDGDTDEEQEPSVVADDAKVTVEVNGESKEFTVGDLKRLAGQEAALTQKSQKVSEQQQQYETGLKAQRTALEEMVKRAAQRFEPYKNFDFALAAQQYDAETYQALKDDAQSAYADMEFFRKELGQLVAQQDREAQERLQTNARAALQELQDPEKGIPGFNREMFIQLRDYAHDMGISAEDLDQTIYPAAWKIMHKAMEFDRLQKAQAGAKPVRKKSKKVVKTSKTTSSAKASKERTGRQRMHDISTKSGLDSIEAAAEAIMAGWQS
jgi:hypothetical protein